MTSIHSPVKPELTAVNNFFDNHFGQRPYFSCIYGSFANGNKHRHSDLDLFAATPTIMPGDGIAAAKFIVGYHRAQGLAIDEEVPYENKLVVCYDDVRASVALLGLDVTDDQIRIPPIIKSEAFLNSIAVRRRLIFNALTVPHFVAGNDINSYTQFRREAEVQLVRLAISQLQAGTTADISNLLGALLVGPNGEEGEMYLGYKPHKSVISYLERTLVANLTTKNEKNRF